MVLKSICNFLEDAAVDLSSGMLYFINTPTPRFLFPILKGFQQIADATFFLGRLEELGEYSPELLETLDLVLAWFRSRCVRFIFQKMDSIPTQFLSLLTVDERIIYHD